MYTQADWDATVIKVVRDIPKFKISFKDETPFQKLISKLSFWNSYEYYTTTLYPKVHFASQWSIRHFPVSTLEHEWVHLKDQETFFGLSSKKISWVNVSLFYFSYLIPQVFALLALLAVFNLWWLLCLLFLLPLPAPFRAWAEVRAYRRSIENGNSPEDVQRAFTGAGYYFMWPFKAHLKKWLEGDSPYKKEMEA